jgi:DNA-binding CsgD family transcriptional regulator
VALPDADAAYDAKAWQRAFDLYAESGDLDARDLDHYAVSAMLLGRMEDYFAIRERAYHQALDADDVDEAARAALWIGMQKMVQGEVGAGGGWLARAANLAAEPDTGPDVQGYLTMAGAFGAVAEGDVERAIAMSAEATGIGRRHHDPDLVGLSLHQQGLLLLEAGRTDEGLARLDEAMVGLAGGELSPMVTGIVYCGVISGCWTVYELRRAQEWTAAMTAWCEAQTDLHNFNGECKVRRAELKRLQGQWAEALEELASVSTGDADAWAAGCAAYVRGDLNRLQGSLDAAEEDFADAARLGFDPQPGLALLRLARGSSQAAGAMVRRSLAETTDVGKRIELLHAAVEVMLALDDLDGAAGAVEELAAISARNHSPIVASLHQHSLGALLLARGQADAALAPLRRALDTWVRVPARHQEARARVLVGSACRALDDRESAERELETARAIFQDLGATPDLSRLTKGEAGLSPRELEVLRLLATGATNKTIAAKLVLSERTVDRHVSNIFVKLGVSSRAAATAYAFERQLV